MTIKLELPQDNASVLFHFGEAMKKVASDLEPTLHNTKVTTLDPIVTNTVEVSKQDEAFAAISTGPFHWVHHESCSAGSLTTIDELHELMSGCSSITEISESELDRLASGNYEVTCIPDDVLIDIDTDVTPPPVTTPPVEASIPWDKRIHSSNKSKTNDGEFKLRRKPQDQTSEQWSAYVETVKIELEHLTNIPVITEAVVSPIETVVPPVEAVVPPVEAVVPPVEAVVPPVEVVVPPVEVVVPPVEVVVPPVEAGLSASTLARLSNIGITTVPSNFGEMMRYITGNKAIFPKDVYDSALGAHDLTALPMLATKPDLIPQVFATLNAMVD